MIRGEERGRFFEGVGGGEKGEVEEEVEVVRVVEVVK